MQYIGTELELFANATNWKSYVGQQLAAYIYGDVLEVGAGIGATTPFLFNDRVRSWRWLEPDPRLGRELGKRHGDKVHGRYAELLSGTLDSLEPELRFDSIVYVDVLEHLEDDQRELEQAALRLKTGGALVVLAPAHQSLMSEFDRAIGHFRRYNRKTLGVLSPAGVRVEESFYLDSVGLLLSLANRWILRQPTPRYGQVVFWDRFIIPLSRIADRLLRKSLGKSVVVIWRRPGTAP